MPATGPSSTPAGVALPESYGARQAVITAGGRHRLVIGGGVPQDVWPDALSAPDFPTEGVTPALHGAVTPPVNEVRGALHAVQMASGLPISGSQRRLLWAGTIGDRRHGVLAVTAAGGAHVVGVFRQLGAPADMGTRLTAGAVLPAGPLEDVAMARPNPRPQRSDDAGIPSPAARSPSWARSSTPHPCARCASSTT